MSIIAGLSGVWIGVGLTFSYFQGELGSKIVTLCSPYIDAAKLTKIFFAKFLTLVRNFAPDLVPCKCWLRVYTSCRIYCWPKQTAEIVVRPRELAISDKCLGVLDKKRGSPCSKKTRWTGWDKATVAFFFAVAPFIVKVKSTIEDTSA